MRIQKVLGLLAQLELSWLRLLLLPLWPVALLCGAIVGTWLLWPESATQPQPSERPSMIASAMYLTKWKP